MANILITYASMSGNTEEIANLLKETLISRQHTVTLQEIDGTDVNELLSYDGILVGSYTWGDGELPYEVEDFYDNLEGLDLVGKKVGVFGSGDTAYPLFCEAVPIFERALTDRGAELAVEGLMVEFAPEDDEEIKRCQNFADHFSNRLEMVLVPS